MPSLKPTVSPPVSHPFPFFPYIFFLLCRHSSRSSLFQLSLTRNLILHLDRLDQEVNLAVFFPGFEEHAKGDDEKRSRDDADLHLVGNYLLHDRHNVIHGRVARPTRVHHAAGRVGLDIAGHTSVTSDVLPRQPLGVPVTDCADSKEVSGLV